MVPRRSSPIPWLLCAVLLAALTLSAAPGGPLRVVAVADVHGAFAEFVAILQQTNVVDANRRWCGGSTTLVQTGDLLDRGAHARDVLDLAMALEQQAPKAGGAFVPLLGNHEVMNAMGDLRYVTPQIYRSFATAGSEEVRAKALKEYVDFTRAHAGHGHAFVAVSDDAGRATWMDEHPPGFFEYRDAMGPDGTYGRWIRRHRAVVRIGDGLFVHGGLNPTLPIESVDAIDSRVRAEIAGFDDTWRALTIAGVVWRYMTLRQAVAFLEEEQKWTKARSASSDPAIAAQVAKLLAYRQWTAVSSDGPLWYRGLVKDVDAPFTAGLDALLARLGASYVVVGHTVQEKSTVRSWIGGRVFALDTGMLPEEYKGRASALEIKDGRFTIHYADGTTQTMDRPARTGEVRHGAS
jgi:hypothetical protein